MLVESITLVATLLGFILALLRVGFLHSCLEDARDQLSQSEERSHYWQHRATCAERQLPAFRNWPDLADPGVTQTIRIFDEWGPREQ